MLAVGTVLWNCKDCWVRPTILYEGGGGRGGGERSPLLYKTTQSNSPYFTGVAPSLRSPFSLPLPALSPRHLSPYPPPPPPPTHRLCMHTGQHCQVVLRLRKVGQRRGFGTPATGFRRSSSNLSNKTKRNKPLPRNARVFPISN